MGLPGSGRSTLFAALTGGQGPVGTVPVPDERLEPVAAIESSTKITPVALEVVDVPGSGPALLGNLRQMDALLAVVDAFSGTRETGADREALLLEMVVADRDHVEGRLERVRTQAKSGDPRLRQEVAELERVLAHAEAGHPLSEYPGQLPRELEPLTTKPLVAIENGPSVVDLKLEAESSAEEAALHSIGRKSMLQLIENLSHEQQQVLTLKFVFNFSNGEAAAILGKTEGAVKSLQHRALASLQKQISSS